MAGLMSASRALAFLGARSLRTLRGPVTQNVKKLAVNQVSRRTMAEHATYRFNPPKPTFLETYCTWETPFFLFMFGYHFYIVYKHETKLPADYYDSITVHTFPGVMIDNLK